MMAWYDIASRQKQGLNVQYQMLCGIFMAPGVTLAQLDS